MSRPSRQALRKVVQHACRAPSVHNTQPWLWRIADDATLELHADPTRQLPIADPDGRNLAISCGAALHYAVEAAGALGLSTGVELLPESSRSDLLARIAFSSARPPADAVERLMILDQRCTDRRRFTSWPVPETRLHQLAESASGWRAFAVPIVDVSARFRAELVMERAMRLQATDVQLADEQASWIEHGPGDGLPASNVAPASRRQGAERPNRFLPDAAVSGTFRQVESSDGLVAICTADDDRASWLWAGETLSALWLHATRAGLSIVPLSQVVEVPETRAALQQDVLAGMARPQLLVRVGWQEIARSTLPRTPRRPLEDVLVA